MKNMKKFFKMVAVILVGITIFHLCTTGVYAKVNSDYFSTTIDTSTADTSTTFVSTIASEIMKYITKFVLTVAKLVENVIKNFATRLFGVNVFPWEDLIVFNSLPYLDINFFNASDGSIFSTTAGDIVKTVYFSLLTLSLSIVGIGVAVTAIKLAISSIAAEKAKYKEAITKCLYTVILLFSVHILLSFIFYLNEEICEGASKLLESLLTQEEIDSLANEVENAEKSATTFVYANTYGVYNGLDDNLWIEINAGLTSVVSFSDYKAKMEERYNSFHSIVDGNSKVLNIANYLISSDTYLSSRFGDKTFVNVDSNGNTSSNIDFWDWDYINSCFICIERLNIDLWNVKNIGDLSSFRAAYGDDDRNTEWYAVLENVYTTYYLGQYDSEISNVISTLGNTFKDDANGIYLNSTDDDNAYIATYLYAILIIQSIMLLISYLKRIFYVTLLAVLAPVVVVYDFFMGDSNKVFNTWIKELCSLVFVQAMQAMLLAIMLAIVVKLYTDAGDGDEAAKQSVGLYAIFIMVIIPKVELLVKRIFGLGSGVADVSMTGGKESLLKTGMALRLGGRVLNNAGKFVGGAVGVGSGLLGAGRKQSNIAKNNYEAAKLNANGGGSSGSLGTSTGSGGTASNRIGASRSSLSGASAALPDDQNVTVGNLAQAIRSASAKSPEDLEQEMKDARHKRWQQVRQGAQQMASGALETAGAIGGASLGAVLSMGTGGDDLVSNMIAGAGLGDVAGETAANLTAGTANKMVDWNYDRRKLNEAVKKSEDKLDKARQADVAYRATIASAGHTTATRNVSQPTGTPTARRVVKTPTSTANTTNKNTSRQLSTNAKQYYDKAVEAKNKGNMEEYKQNRAIAAGMMKAEKNAQRKTSANKNYTRNTSNAPKMSTVADTNRVTRNKARSTPSTSNSSANSTNAQRIRPANNDSNRTNNTNENNTNNSNNTNN